METADPESPPKPCGYFDKIGDTSTGGSLNGIVNVVEFKLTSSAVS